ncbi:hypothetical protein JOD07_002128 [Defluviitalea raffinosedens]|nr:hypothetical protein [Defluviitalea raffinosedens]
MVNSECPCKKKNVFITVNVRNVGNIIRIKKDPVHVKGRSLFSKSYSSFK